MKKYFLIILFFLSFNNILSAANNENDTFLQQVEQNNQIVLFEENNFDTTQTLIHESNNDYIVIENKSSPVYISLISASTLENYNKPNNKYLSIAENECTNNKARFNVGQELNNSFSNIMLINKYKAKFMCVTEEENYKYSLYKMEDFYSEFCPAISASFEIICSKTETKITRYKKEFKQFILSQKLLNEKEDREIKIQTCKAYGFKEETESFGKCIFKLMEIDLEYVKLRSSIF